MRDLILLAGGLQQSALLTEAEVARLPADRARGATAETFRTPLDSSFLVERAPDGTYLGPPGVPGPSSRAPEVELKPYDFVLILQQPDWQLQRTVTLTGEVRYPGQYSLRSRTERLRDVLARAGGLTSAGYAEGIRFYRKRDDVGRIGLDLTRVLRSARDRDNLLLEEGDSVFIPTYSPVVTVGGAVNSPVSVAYVPGRDIDYYVRAAGGPSRLADSKRAYVTQPNGSVQSRQRSLLFSRNPVPRAGSEVHVPERDPNERKDYVAMAGAVAQILASIVAVIVVVTR
jgi:protein involved in polysaccharide export with SLBB domain